MRDRKILVFNMIVAEVCILYKYWEKAYNADCFVRCPYLPAEQKLFAFKE